MRVVLFTDTLGDVNGVSRFIRNMAEQSALEEGMPGTQGVPGGGEVPGVAEDAGRSGLVVLTSTRLACPVAANIVNIRPRFARAMPGYPGLEVVVPPLRRLLGLTRRLRPDVIHASTPGPVGAAGRCIAGRLGLPLVGTYHTDFPAYVGHLFDDHALTWACSAAVRRFYRPFARVLSRSRFYEGAMGEVGIGPDRLVRLTPGIDTEAFSTRHRPASEAARRAFWSAYPGVEPGAVKALYVGRVSVEKNLPLLMEAWWRVTEGPWGDATRPQLVVIGDGPYRSEMERELRGRGVVFLGFRHGEELSRLYAASDFFLFPSLTDTLGQAVLEAQASGLAVVVSTVGGPAEVVRARARARGGGVVGAGGGGGGGAEPTGMVVPASGPGSVRGWSEAARRLVADHALRRALGAAGAAMAGSMSIRRSFEHFRAVHGEVAAGWRRPRQGPRAGGERAGADQ